MASIIRDIRHLVKHTAIYGMANMLGKAIGFLLIPLYTHYIPPADYGTLEILDISINIIGMFVGLGLANSVARFYYQVEAREEKNQVVSSAVILLLGLTSLMLCLVLPFSERLACLLFDNPQLGNYIKISLFTFALNAILEIPLTMIRAREQSLFFAGISLGRLALSLGLNIFFIVFLRLGILGILYSGLITSAFFSVGLAVWCIRECGFHFHYRLARQMLLFGAPLIVNSAGMFIINFGDRYLLKANAGLEEVGIYSLGYKIGMGLIAFLIGQPFFLIWSCRRYSLIEEENGVERYGRIFILYTLLLLWIWLFIVGFSKEMITILAPASYGAAWRVLPLVAMGYVLRELADFFRGAFMIKNKTYYTGAITLAVSLYCLFSYLVFIPRYHAMGAAMATCSTFLAMAVINGFFAVRVMPEINYRFRRLIILFFCCGIASASLLFCNNLVDEQWLRIIVKLTIIAVTIFLSLVLAFTREEKRSLIRSAMIILE